MQTPNHGKQLSATVETKSFQESTLSDNISLSKAMAKAKENRQKATENAQLLANRISLLKHEQEKLTRKINETHKKTFELYKVKKNNQEWKNLVLFFLF